ncbi:hypothetical protein CONPUDRAFT_36957, partial [Coniophora puteana RWD-64-598 SS2]
DYSLQQLDTLTIFKDQIHEHKTLRVNYTTYDLRREQDILNPRSRADLMVLSDASAGDDAPHPYWFARLVYTFHVNVYFRGEDPSACRQVVVLLVRWFEHDSSYASGFEARRLPRVAFHPLGTSQCWDFIDPATVIRGAHLIPGF